MLKVLNIVHIMYVYKSFDIRRNQWNIQLYSYYIYIYKRTGLLYRDTIEYFFNFFLKIFYDLHFIKVFGFQKKKIVFYNVDKWISSGHREHIYAVIVFFPNVVVQHVLYHVIYLWPDFRARPGLWIGVTQIVYILRIFVKTNHTLRDTEDSRREWRENGLNNVLGKILITA